jgi:CBS domain-containing protein
MFTYAGKMAPSQNLSDHFYTKKVADLHHRKLLVFQPGTAVSSVAAVMAEQKMSCVFVGTGGDDILGYVTDITLRDQVLAKGISPETEVSKIMDRGIVYIQQQAFLYEALLLMFRTKTRYLLVRNQGKFVGWISRNKILSEQAQGPFMFIQSVKQALDTEELATKWAQLPSVVHDLLSKGMKAQIINQIVTAVSDAIALRIIENVIHEMGPPPAKFVFFVLGSEGRSEQTLKTDQDNAIIYEDKANEHRELVREYFLEFADRVSTDLDRVGIVFCKGGYMAKNPKWTHSLSHWKRNYENWIQESSQETVMQYATFFDCRAIFGDFSLLDELKEFMSELLEKAPERFFVNMGYNALQYEPPLSFFHGIKTYQIDGERHFNIKKTMTPIVDLARVFSLKHRILETNTGDRVKALESKGVFSHRETIELGHAYYYLMGLRLEKQSLQLIQNEEKATNHVSIDHLTKVQMVTLVEIFKVIKDFQLKIKVEFTKNIF